MDDSMHYDIYYNLKLTNNPLSEYLVNASENISSSYHISLLINLIRYRSKTVLFSCS